MGAARRAQKWVHSKAPRPPVLLDTGRRAWYSFGAPVIQVYNQTRAGRVFHPAAGNTGRPLCLSSTNPPVIRSSSPAACWHGSSSSTWPLSPLASPPGRCISSPSSFFALGADKKNIPSIFAGGSLGLLAALGLHAGTFGLAPSLGALGAFSLSIGVVLAVIILGGTVCPVACNNVGLCLPDGGYRQL